MKRYLEAEGQGSGWQTVEKQIMIKIGILWCEQTVENKGRREIVTNLTEVKFKDVKQFGVGEMEYVGEKLVLMALP